MCDPVQVELEFEVCLALDVVSAVAPVLPPATDAASVAKSASTAALIAIVSPADTAVLAVNESFVWFPMLSSPVKRLFQCAAVIVDEPPDTVAK